MTGNSQSYRDYEDSCSGNYPPEDFEGLCLQHWQNGQIKYRGEYRRGRMRVGQHMSFYENGVLQELTWWDEGWVSGVVLWFRDNGSKECEKDYGEHGGRTRSWTERWYGPDSALWKVKVWKGDAVIAEWEHPESRKLWKAIGADKIVEDAVRMVYPDE